MRVRFKMPTLDFSCSDARRITSQAAVVWGLLLGSTLAVSQEKPATPPVVAPAAAVITSSPTPTNAAKGVVSTVIDAKSDAKTDTKTDAKTDAKPLGAEEDAAKEKPKAIGLIVPVSSKALGPAATALRSGFLAAAEQATKDKFVARVYLADDEAMSLSSLYRNAVKDGVVAIVGGLTRDGAGVVAREAGFVPTLALNVPPDLAKADAASFFHISLSLDWDARLAARRAWVDNLRNAVIVHTNSALAKRVEDAFEKEWLRLGGTILNRIVFSGDLADGPKLKAEMEKPDAAKAEFVFLSADMPAARFARPYFPQGLPVFATAQSFDPRAGAVENLDLESVKFPEIPWFAERDHAAVMSYPRPSAEMPAEYERLYALGIDAWRIAYALVSTPPPPKGSVKSGFMPLDGVTGRISLDGNQFVRSLALVEMRDGRTQLVKPSE
jgi:uncharacterized protein